MIFSDITVSWEGAEYIVPAREVMPLIAAVEHQLTIGRDGQSALQVIYRDGGPPLSNLAMAYAAVLKQAGVTVEAGEVYQQILVGDKETGGQMMADAVVNLIALMMPPAAFQPEANGAPGNPGAS